MEFRNISFKLAHFAALGAGAILAVACNSAGPAGRIATGVQLASMELADTAMAPARALAPSGEKASEFKAIGIEVSLPDMPGFTEKDLILAIDSNADISRDVTVLRSITRIVYTNVGTFDLFAGDALTMILEVKDGKWIVRESLAAFKAESIDYVAAKDIAAAVAAPLTFNLRQCLAADVAPAPEAPPINEQTAAPIAPEQSALAAVEPRSEEKCTNVRVVLTVEKEKAEVTPEQKPIAAPAVATTVDPTIKTLK
jgi:hypothetical protein